MSALAGNTYAEKWSFDRTMNVLRMIDHHSKKDTCLYLGHALAEAHCYNDLWAYWRRKWRTRYEVMDLMQMILQRLEVRLFQKMADKSMPAQAAMFALKHHYGWGRASEPDQTADLRYIDNEPTPPEGTSPPAPEVDIKRIQDTDNPLQEVRDFMAERRRKIEEYNATHPERQLPNHAPWFDGAPPKNLDVVAYEDGYFMWC
jgi:hypothetical protein